jgi:hypothetical protein
VKDEYKSSRISVADARRAIRCDDKHSRDKEAHEAGKIESSLDRGDEILIEECSTVIMVIPAENRGELGAGRR